MSNLMSIFDGPIDELTFKLKAGDHEESALVVAGFVAVECLSTLFNWNIDVVIDPEVTPSLNDTIGKDAEFRILRDGDVQRIVRGIVGQVTPHGHGPNVKQRLVTVSVVPKLTELKYITSSRIFQDKPVNEIVDALLQPHGIQSDWRIARPAPRPYRVQRGETDFTFFCRILADAGIHFHFFCDEDAAKVVFVDDPHGYVDIEGDAKLPFREVGGAVTVDHVGGIHYERGVRTGSVVMRDYDFKEPTKELTVREDVAGPHNDESRPQREQYLYHGEYAQRDEGDSLAKRRLEEARSDSHVFRGRSSCARLEVGRKFTLEHPDETFNSELLVTRLDLRGRRAGVLADTGQDGGPGFSASFAAVPAETMLRPRRKDTPPAHPDSARVVGPTNGSPFVDKFGRVKVQFHWDREGKNDEHSSCWLRVLTPAAGGARGIWFPPRVGDEVIVMHLDGDIDRPFVAGAIYNALESQPNPLPGDASKSTIKTLTIPGGKGFNELTFQDTAGGEEIFLHAQKDRRTVVLHNHNETVGANQTVSVGANQTISVGANRTASVGANETISVGAKRTETVGKGEAVTIKKGRTHTIETGDDKLEVSVGNRDVKVQLKDTHHAQSKVETLDVTYELKAGTSITIHHPNDSKLFLEAGKASLTTTSEIVLSNPSGSITLADGKVQIVAKDEVVIGSGKASMSLLKDGSVSIKGPKEVQASSGTSFVKVEPAKATLSGPMADVVAKAIAKVMGALVKIN